MKTEYDIGILVCFTNYNSIQTGLRQDNTMTDSDMAELEKKSWMPDTTGNIRRNNCDRSNTTTTIHTLNPLQKAEV
jgi:hypothetical protein